jgi:ABC-type lipoprotein export system ATPase subunit
MMIKITNLNKYFNKGRQNEIHVINNTSIEFPQTGLIALTGPSGCGKTTLLNVIGGLDRFAKGEIDFDGNIIKKYKPNEWDVLRNKYVGYIFQNYNLLTDKTVYENVEISLNMAGLYNKEKVQERINYVLESVGMYNYRRRNVQALSGGQQQRVAIARAIAKNPKVVLADEPTGNLDANNTFEIMSIIKKISQTCLVILVSHEKALVQFYADRIIELKDGVVVSDSTNEGNRTLEHVDVRNIYLRDLEKQETDLPVKLEYYYDQKKEEVPNLKVVYTNNTLYIKADAKAKIKYVTDDSEIRLLDQNYKKPETLDATQHLFDLNQFGKIIADFQRKSFIRFRDTLKAGFQKVFRRRKLIGKMFLLAYFVISALIAYNLATFTNISGVRDKDFLTTARGLVAVPINRDITYADVNDILALSSITSLNFNTAQADTLLIYTDFYQGDLENNWSSGTYMSAYPIKLSEAGTLNVVVGQLPQNNRQVVIDEWVADQLLKNQSLVDKGASSHRDLIGARIGATGDNVSIAAEIVGIVRTQSPIIVMTDDNFTFVNKRTNISYMAIAKGVASGDYVIAEGRDILSRGEVLVSDETSYSLGDSISVGSGVSAEVVGKYHSANIRSLIMDNADYVEVATRMLIQTYGSYVSSETNVSLFFHTNDISQAIADITDLGFSATDSYQNARAVYQISLNAEIAQKLRVILISLLASIIYLVFTMRSSMLGRIKEVGIYRSIGATKRDVYKIFVSEILSFTTIGSMTGYLAMTFIIIQFQKFNPLAANEFYFPLHIFIAGIIGIYCLNVVFGMLPVYGLLRKTPSEINAKYDI